MSENKIHPARSGAGVLKARYLKPNLSILEITVYTAAWIVAVLYSCVHVFEASRREKSFFVH